jgi:tRNA nucleotidyltransferase/poly(A) polymerase
VVGGAVRDRLLKRATPDIDLVVPRSPDLIAADIAETLGGTAFVMDAERGITRVTLRGGGQNDVAAFQGETLEADLDRRDFAVNALAVPFDRWTTRAWKNAIVDRHGGAADAVKKRLSAVSPHVFKEDPLRLLRAFRLGAELGFSIPGGTMRLVKRDRRLLKKSAPERVRE